jgi:hypothetical protein
MLPSEESNGKVLEDTPAVTRHYQQYEDDFFAELNFADPELDNIDNEFEHESFLSVDESIKECTNAVENSEDSKPNKR